MAHITFNSEKIQNKKIDEGYYPLLLETNYNSEGYKILCNVSKPKMRTLKQLKDKITNIEKKDSARNRLKEKYLNQKIMNQ